MNSGIKREANEGPSSVKPEGKKIKTEKSTAVEGDAQTNQRVVKVQLELEDRSVRDNDDDDEESQQVYVDMEDANECMQLEFPAYGGQGDDSCLRTGRARVLVDGSVIGWIGFNLIDRVLIADGECSDMLEVCDAQSADLCDLALKFFEDDGSVKGHLAEEVSEEASFAYFLYINEIKLDPPYGRTATEENVAVAADAIDKFVRSPAFNNGEVTVTLAM
jgi:hypothetical protein